MLSTENSVLEQKPSSHETASAMDDLSLDLLELELSLNDFSEDKIDFPVAVADAVRRLGGDFLFELPASGLAQNCLQIAAIRIPDPGSKELKVAFALLDQNGSTIRVEDPDEQTEDLKRFAEAFVGVLERF